MLPIQALPIDDVIMPKIEAGKWRPYPYAPTRTVSKEHYHHVAGTEMRVHYESGLLHQLPQVTTSFYIYIYWYRILYYIYIYMFIISCVVIIYYKQDQFSNYY